MTDNERKARMLWDNYKHGWKDETVPIMAITLALDEKDEVIAGFKHALMKKMEHHHETEATLRSSLKEKDEEIRRLKETAYKTKKYLEGLPISRDVKVVELEALLKECEEALRLVACFASDELYDTTLWTPEEIQFIEATYAKLKSAREGNHKCEQ